MARIRTVKPEYWTHPVMGRLDDSTKCLGIAILNFSDDEGYFLADPNLVRSSCRPFDDDSAMTRCCIAKLVAAGWVEIVEHPSHGPIGKVVNFKGHQVIDRPKASKLKAYFISDESAINQGSLDVGKEGKGKEWNGMEVEDATTTPGGSKGKSKSKSAPKPGAQISLDPISPAVADVVNRCCGSCPKADPDGRVIRLDPSLMAERVEVILASGNAVITGDLLVASWDAYVASQPKGTKAPQYFFGQAKDQNNPDAANWHHWARLVYTKQTKAKAAAEAAAVAIESPEPLAS